MEDAELTHTGAGMPMGELMRRFWQPVCLSSEITDLPHAIRILGEDLVAFRDKRGAIGVLHRHCSHRGTSLEYGTSFPNAESAAAITGGCSTRMARSWRPPASRRTAR